MHRRQVFTQYYKGTLSTTLKSDSHHLINTGFSKLYVLYKTTKH